MSVALSHRVGDVGVVVMDKPPVNAFGAALRRALWEAIDAMDRAPDVRAIVLHGQGRGFSAGGDIHEFGTPAAQAWPGLSSDLHPRIESCSKPVIAAVHGLCLGGGLETAMACHWRIVSAETTVGLPEVRVGVLPLSGTQRLPRLIGLLPAAQHIAAGEKVPVSMLPGIADQMVASADAQPVVEAAIAFARSCDVGAPGQRLVRHRPVLGLEGAQRVLEMAHAATQPIVRCALQAVMAAAEAQDFDAGLEQARSLYNNIITSAESVALQRAFVGGDRRPQ